MRRPFEDPLEDDLLEARAWEHYRTARDQGSLLTEDQLIEQCREMAKQETEQLEALGEEPAQVGATDEE
jgi:hypothetical protein